MIQEISCFLLNVPMAYVNKIISNNKKYIFLKKLEVKNYIIENDLLQFP